MTKHRLLLLVILAVSLPALACSTPARLMRGWLASPTPLPSLTPIPSSTPQPSSTPTLQATSSVLPPVSVVEHPLQETSEADQYEIKAVFPYLPAVVSGAEVFNAEMADFEETTLAGFRIDAAQAAPAPSASVGSFLQSRYEMLYNQNGLFSLRLWISIYMKGAAHPGTFSKTFNYDLQTGASISLNDLFQPDAQYLPVLAKFCQAEVLRRDSAFWPDGAGADPANYRSWNLTADGLMVTFDEYQVAPYAAGPQSVLVPYATLTSLLDTTGPLQRVLP
jgi:hypothetical protein